MNYKAEDIINLIYKRYSGDEYVVLEQVPDGTGSYQRRWIDAAVFSLWPSKGLDRMAFEVKVSRSDFLHELSNPLKHQWAKESFHQFWFVAPKDVIQIEELPNGTGWMYPRGDKLCIKKHCQRNEKPKLDDTLLAGFMRAAHKSIVSSSKISAKEFLANNETHQNALAFQEAVRLFCESRGETYYSSIHGDSTQDIMKHLEAATMDKQLKQDRDQFLLITNRFKRNIAGLFGLFAIIANKSLIERDETGKHLIKAFGGDDNEEALDSLRGYKPSEYDKRAKELIDIILAWDKL